MSPIAAIQQLRAVISKEVEILWHIADTNNDTLFTSNEMDIIYVNYDHNSKYVFSQTRHIFHLQISDLLTFFDFAVVVAMGTSFASSKGTHS